MNDPKINFNMILEIINYTGNKDELYDKLFGLSYMNAIIDLIETLPEDKIMEASKLILETKDLEQIENLKKYFNQEQVNNSLKKASSKIFQEFYESIKLTLSEAQVSSLTNYLSSINAQVS
jgi:hypothetical protein